MPEGSRRSARVGGGRESGKKNDGGRRFIFIDESSGPFRDSDFGARVRWIFAVIAALIARGQA
jgi:hypothetical protein